MGGDPDVAVSRFYGVDHPIGQSMQAGAAVGHRAKRSTIGPGIAVRQIPRTGFLLRLSQTVSKSCVQRSDNARRNSVDPR